MSTLTVFDNRQFGKVRTILIEGEPWFVAADVCRALELGNVTETLKRLDTDEKMTLNSTDGHSGTRGGAQMFNVINESGLYTLVLGSRKPEAKAFKRWIVHDVIPSIRKHGAYMTPDKLTETLTRPESVIELLQALVNEQARVKELTSTNAALAAEANTWEPRMVLNRLARAYAGKKYGGMTGAGWKVFYDRLLYKGHINLESRRTRANGKARPLLDFIHPDEWPQAVKIMTALCEEAGINTGKLLTSENKKTIK